MKYFNNFPIRYKLLISYSAIFILAISFGSFVSYAIFHKTIATNIESELKNTTTMILNMVKTAANVSIKNHLRAVAERNKEIVEYYYNKYKQGELSESKAKEIASEILLCQTIGKSGYIYCLDSNGVCVLHPKKSVIGVDYSNRAFIREQKLRKTGYVEYDWKNPEDKYQKPKALYMSYFEPWDWIISVSSYRDDFINLVNVEDFRDSILSLRFGKTGYSFIIDTKGNLIVHPKTEGANYFDTKDAEGHFFVQEVCRRKNGKIIYSWRNPEELVFRKKIAIFNFIPEFNWIVESSGYLEEFYAPLKTMRNLMIVGAMLALFMVLPVSFRLSAAITSPIKRLMYYFEAGANGNFTTRIKTDSEDELGQLAGYYNMFMEKLEAYSNDLNEAVCKYQKTMDALKLSEEMFSKAFRSSPNGIAITTLKEGRFVNVNQGFLNSTGYKKDQVIGKNWQELKIMPSQEERLNILDVLENKGCLQRHEFEFYTKTGEPRIGILAAEIIELWDEPCMLSNVIDVTESRRLEKEIMDISDRERRKIGQDLHDDLCPHLIGIEGLIKVMTKKLKEVSPKKALIAEKVQELIKEAINKSRRLARGLCPVYLVAHGLESSLKELACNVEDVFNVSCTFKSNGLVLFNDNTIATHVFHIAQEAVNNAIRRGKADNIIIDLSVNIQKINLKIIDNGLGIKKNIKSTGMGLRIMSYRAKIIGGVLEIIPGENQGTCVHLSLRNNMGITKYDK